MSGNPCRCSPPDRSRWVVLQRRGHHSAFNGYRRTPSEYSSVVCLGCGAIWRTKAAYVLGLPDAPADWQARLPGVQT